jgi:hypothetical protein
MFRQWGLIEIDLQDIGIDVEDPDLMERRSWHWLRKRILGLLSKPSRLRAALISE